MKAHSKLDQLRTLREARFHGMAPKRVTKLPKSVTEINEAVTELKALVALVEKPKRGRPAKHASHAKRQAAYRARRKGNA